MENSYYCWKDCTTICSSENYIGNVINKAAEATKPVTPVNEVKATPVVEKVEAKPVDNNKKEEEKKDSSNNNNDKKDEKKDNKDNKGGFKPINNPNNK